MRNGGAFRAITSLALVIALILSSVSLGVWAQEENASDRAIEQAKSLQKEGHFQEAVRLLNQALSQDPNNLELSKALGQIKKQEAKKYFKQGLALYQKGEYEEAIPFFEKSLSADPSYGRSQKYKEASLHHLSAATPEEAPLPPPEETGSEESLKWKHSPNLAKARTLFEKGRALLNEGKLDEAQEKFEEVLEYNPYHVIARKYILLLQNRQNSFNAERQTIEEASRMMDVQKEWLPPKKEKPALEIVPPWKMPLEESQARKDLETQSEQIIPAINFNNAHLADVVKYLSRISGINIIMDESVFQALSSEEAALRASEPVGQAQAPPSHSTPKNAPGGEASAPPPPSAQKSDRVTISLKDVPLIEALKYILRAKGLRYMIEDYAIIIVAADYVPPEDYETRYYHLSSGVAAFTSFEMSQPEEKKAKRVEPGSQGGEVSETITIKDVLEQSGVPWPEGSKIFLDQRTGTLIVRNTPTNLKIVEDILRTLDVAPYQVAITARFIELENADAEEMGLEWLLRDDLKFFLHEGSTGGLTPAGALQRFQFDRLTKTVGATPYDQALSGNLRYFTSDPLTGQISTSLTGAANPIVSFSGILTKPEFSIVLHAISQKTKSNLLSSPRVTTVNGQRAQIKVVQEFIYPTEYDVTPATTNSQGTVTTPPVVSPGNFETRDIGIVLDVTPNVGADRKTVNLTIIPEVSEFVTWLDYGVPTQTFTGTDGVLRTLPGYPILQPLFSTRNVTTSVIVDDGDTVVLGGMIRDQISAYHDKIPILGDVPFLGLLFRKKGEISVKKNLIIFVTAELLTPSGDPYGPTQMEPGETLVPQAKPETPAAMPAVPAGVPSTTLLSRRD